jgi:hypothetical protein
MKLGKNPVKHDARTLRMARYLPTRLTAPPTAVDHYAKVTAWPMYSNDVLGDCGPAGAAHQIQSWSTYANKPQLPTDAQVRAAYFAITGGADTGVYLLDMMNYWRNTGIAADKIEAFVAISPNLDELRLAVQIFGSAGLGLSLPDQGTFGPWTVVYGPPNPNNGHYVVAVGYDDALRVVKVISWGRRMSMSYDFFLKYNDEAYAVLNDLSLNAAGVTPEGFNLAQLTYDLAHLHDAVTPPPPIVQSSPSASASPSGSESKSASPSSSESKSASPSGSESKSASPSSSESKSASPSGSESKSASPSGSPSPSPSSAPPVPVPVDILLTMSDGSTVFFVRSE